MRKWLSITTILCSAAFAGIPCAAHAGGPPPCAPGVGPGTCAPGAIPASQIGAKGGVASLGATGAVPTAQLPISNPSGYGIVSGDTPVTLRGPTAGDDVTENYVVGQDWLLPNLHVMQSQVSTAGQAQWTDITPGCLPLDCLGLDVTAASLTAGTGLLAGDTVTLAHGTVLTAASAAVATASQSGTLMTVSAVASGTLTVGQSVAGPSVGAAETILSFGTGTGGTGTYNMSQGETVASGAIQAAAFAVATPNYYGCAPGGSAGVGSVAGEAMASTSGAASGITATLSIAYPAAIGVDKLTKCYAGSSLNVSRTDTSQSTDIGFSGYSIDTDALWAAGANTTLKVSIAYDQGGGGSNFTANGNTRPGITPQRLWSDGTPTIVFNGAGGNAYGIPAYTYLTIPTTVDVNFNAETIAISMGFQTIAGLQNVFTLNGSTAQYLSNYFSANSGFSTDFGIGNSERLNLPAFFKDQGNVIILNGTQGSLFVNDYTASTGVNPGNIPLSGGTIGSTASTGHQDIRDFIIEPRSITTAEQSVLAASMYATQHQGPQARNGMVILGASKDNGTGSYWGNSWFRKLSTLLNRPDIEVYNQAEFGGFVSGQVNLWAPVALNLFLPTASSSFWKNKIVFMKPSPNDVNSTVQYLGYIAGNTMTITSNNGFKPNVISPLYSIVPTGGVQGTVTAQTSGCTPCGGNGTYIVTPAQTVGSSSAPVAIGIVGTYAGEYALMQQEAIAVHAAGGKFVCVTDVLTSVGPPNFGNMNALLQQGCDKTNYFGNAATYDTVMAADGIIDFTVVPLFDSNTTWPTSCFTSDGLHLKDPCQDYQADLAYQQIRGQNLISAP